MALAFRTDAERVQRLFEAIDADHSGEISTEELDLFFSKCAQAQPFVRSQYLMLLKPKCAKGNCDSQAWEKFCESLQEKQLLGGALPYLEDAANLNSNPDGSGKDGSGGAEEGVDRRPVKQSNFALCRMLELGFYIAVFILAIICLPDCDVVEASLAQMLATVCIVPIALMLIVHIGAVLAARFSSRNTSSTGIEQASLSPKSATKSDANTLERGESGGASSATSNGCTEFSRCTQHRASVALLLVFDLVILLIIIV